MTPTSLEGKSSKTSSKKW